MHTRRLGKTNLQVSELALGAARGAEKDPHAFRTTVDAAINAGINFIDTAAGYEDGACEEELGKALVGHEQVVVQTKYRPYDDWGPEANYTGSPKELVESAEGSLRRLQRDHLDILLGHGMRTQESFDRFMTDGCFDAMVRLRDQGKVRFLGISELSEGDGSHEVLQHAIPGGALDVVMLTLNMVLQTAAQTVLPLCKEHDVGVTVMMPLNQASRKVGLVSVPAALETVRRLVQSAELPDEPPYAEPTLLDFLEPYSIPEAALRYVLAHDVSTCCVGMRSPVRLEQNLRATDPPYLDDAKLSQLRELFGGIKTQVW